MNKKCAIYCRVSTEDQNPDIQEQTLKEYATRNHYDIYKIYIDTISGTKDTRPMLDELMKDSRIGRFEAVIVWKLDRLGRSLNNLIHIAEEWRITGINLISTTQLIDTTTSTGKLLYHLLGMLAEFEHDLISERVKLGMKYAKTIKKRGKDKKPRRKSGYYLRWGKKGVGGN